MVDVPRVRVQRLQSHQQPMHAQALKRLPKDAAGHASVGAPGIRNGSLNQPLHEERSDACGLYRHRHDRWDRPGSALMTH